MEQIEGYVENIVYRNDDNGYTVFTVIAEDDELTCVGSVPPLGQGEYLEITGEYTVHPVYGQQLKVSSVHAKMPEDTAAMERYLASGAIKGVGAALAHRIIAKFGEDTFRIMEEEPERLAEVKGISLRIAQEIGSQMVGRREIRMALMYLQKYGIAMPMAVRIYEHYGEQIYEIIQTNPYRLAEDMDGIGFKRADEIAAGAGIAPDSKFRIQSGILYVLQQASLQGHTCLPQEELTRQSEEILGVSAEDIQQQYVEMMIERKLIKEEADTPMYYSSYYYNLERHTAQMLIDLNMTYQVPDIEMEDRIRKIESQTGQTLDEMQVVAVKEAVKNGLFIMTGGPGTGKTTTINAMIHYFHMSGYAIELAAPTGRAAKRMSELTGREARTIHRLLEVSGGPEAASGFGRNEDNPLEADVIIIDEMSMVDLSLMHALLKAIPVGARLILVGDTSQLPSVGAGSVLQDMIDSNCFASVRLSKIFRQAAQSDIIVNAHKINEGQQVVLDNKSKDFFFLKRYDAEKITNVMLQLLLQKLPNYVEAKPMEIQVLAPSRKGVLGVEQLNRVLQHYLNPPDQTKREKTYGDTLFREGDKVMQIRNNYQIEWRVPGKFGTTLEKGLGLFNGDVGVIQEMNDFASMMTILFDDGRVVEYDYKMLEDLELAYAITIHKSQGSEYPAVIIPLLGGPRMLLNRNLLYTAVTRAKNCVVLVGNEAVFEEMAANTLQQNRYGGLREKIRIIVENV